MKSIAASGSSFANRASMNSRYPIPSREKARAFSSSRNREQITATDGTVSIDATVPILKLVNLDQLSLHFDPVRLDRNVSSGIAPGRQRNRSCCTGVNSYVALGNVNEQRAGISGSAKLYQDLVVPVGRIHVNPGFRRQVRSDFGICVPTDYI